MKSISSCASAIGTFASVLIPIGFVNTAHADESSSAAATPSIEANVAPQSVPAAAESGSKSPPENGEPRRPYVAGNTLDGASGLLRIWSADSGAPATFRISATETLFSGSGFLCPSCNDVNGNVLVGKDKVTYSATRLQASVTPLSFLEAFASMRFRSVSNDHGEPRVIQVSGDTVLGAKAFLPYRPGRPFTIGGGLALSLLGKNRSLGPSVANLDLTLAGTLDLLELPEPSRVPVRFHANLGYRFDNTGGIADDLEASRSRVASAPERITRIERFGFGINRTDILRLGLGAEWINSYVRPFVEWSLDLPVNRQDYLCRRADTTLGDLCSDQARQFVAIPSRFSLGLRAYPLARTKFNGLMFVGAFDIGTGATSRFVEETMPELPWAFTVGLGYAGGTAHVEVKNVVHERRVNVAVATPIPAELFIQGRVTEKVSSAPVAGAIVRFQGSDQGGVVSDDNGAFRSLELVPGKYKLKLSKEGFSEADCEVEVVAAPANDGIASQDRTTRRAIPTPIECNMARLPAVATVTGLLRDADTTEYVARASVTIFDHRDRKVNLDSDEFGGVRFEKVPAGRVRLQVVAEGYLPSGTELELKPQQTLTIQLSLHKRPKVANVLVTKQELKLKRQVHFVHDSAEILPDSMAILEEVADVLRKRVDLALIEIQGHTDDSGTEAHNLALSSKRANAVRDALIGIGVDSSRLIAKGYGQEKPLVRNINAANRAKNRRVQLVILGGE